MKQEAPSSQIIRFAGGGSSQSRIVKYAVYESKELLFIPGGGFLHNIRFS